MNNKLSLDNPKTLDSPVLFSTIAGKWLELRSSHLKSSSIARYQFLLYKYILPEFGSKPITEILGIHLEEYCSFLLNLGGTNGAGLSTKTVSDMFQVIRCIFNYAKENGYIIGSDYHFRINQAQQSPCVLSVSNQKKLLDYACKTPSGRNAGILLALFLGLRIGEVCALRWEDISFDEGILTVRKTLQRIPIKACQKNEAGKTDCDKKTIVVITSPKSKKSFRVIPIPQIIIDYLKNISPQSGFLLSCSEKAIEPRNMENYYKRVLCDCKIDYVNFHVLRHPYVKRKTKKFANPFGTGAERFSQHPVLSLGAA